MQRHRLLNNKTDCLSMLQGLDHLQLIESFGVSLHSEQKKELLDCSLDILEQTTALSFDNDISVEPDNSLSRIGHPAL